MIINPHKFAVLTCGGVCPGMNDVVRSITMRSYQRGVKDVNGVRYGFRGLNAPNQTRFIELNPYTVDRIHTRGGSFLGTSRDPLDPERAIRTLQNNDITTLFVIGGNGGNAAAARLHQALRDKDIPVKVIGLPKSIDNDIDLIDRCFGFETAVEEASKIMMIARNEAEAVPSGIAIVKVMGRQSGFIAYHAKGADIRLIPEEPLTLNDIISRVKQCLDDGRSCVICVAEGFPLKAESLTTVLRERVPDGYIKYVDPSYLIRGGVTIPADHAYCTLLGTAAVDAALDGHSGITVATKNGEIHYFDTERIVCRVKNVQLN